MNSFKKYVFNVLVQSNVLETKLVDSRKNLKFETTVDVVNDVIKGAKI